MAMRITSLLVAVIAIASHGALADIKRHASVPEALQGTWGAGSDGCKPDDKSAIILAAKSYTGANAKCSIDWVSETASPKGAIYSAHMRCAAPPAQKASVSNLIIRPDAADQISVGADFSHLTAYQRCPAKP
jgi:hypothetical protein